MMSTLPPVHLSVTQPPGYVHALGLLDQARYVRYQLRRLGVQVTLSKNRLREDAINIVFGAHLGFPLELKRRHTCIIFNLEQLGKGGAELPPDYMQLLRHSAVIDYNPDNVQAYCVDPNEVPIVPFLYAPYLKADSAPALEDRPIDLLFFGSMNPRRQAFIRRIESTGRSVTMFDQPIYGAERDDFIRQAKAVVNCHFYESNRFEQARASHCLSLGTPFISERTSTTRPAEAFEDAVFWVDEQSLERFFADEFGQPSYYEAAYAKLARFQEHDPIEAYADLMGFALGFHKGNAPSISQGPWQPNRVNLGSGKDYRVGWLNVDVLDRAEPDLVLDLGQPIELPISRPTRFGGTVELSENCLDTIYANNVLEHVPDLPMLMGNALTLLKVDGVLEIEVPYEKALTAWQDPTHLRALNENSWIYYTDWFWYLGWFTHRFAILESSWLNLQLQPCQKSDAAFMRVKLQKVLTSPHERTVARVMQADFGGIEDDTPDPHMLVQTDA